MIVITGANGKLGRSVVRKLLDKVPAAEIVAAVRTPEKAGDFAELGVQVREADYARPETLNAAFAGADKILLISSSEVGQRVTQHKAVIDAAKKVGAKLLAYTSILRADSSVLALATEHKATEEYIKSSGLAFVLLRNGWYLENHTEAIAPALQNGVIAGAAGDGRFASATRADYAGSAATVLTTEGHENKTYELAGDESYTLTELASELSKQAHKQVKYQNLPQQEYAAMLIGFGLPPSFAGILADADAGAAKGELDSSSHDLRTLLGRPTTSLTAALGTALSSS